MVIDPFELRARPQLLAELREHPGEHAERRFAALLDVEARSQGDGTVRMTGLAAVFNDLSVNLGGFREKIDRGAFRKVLTTDPDVRALFNHDLNYPLARSTVPDGPGSLTLKEVPKGLRYDYEPTDTSYARDLRVNMDAGVITQSSFAFRISQGGDSWDEDPETGALIRTIHEFSELYDVSPVTDPAYVNTTAGLRSRGDGTDLQLLPGANAPQPGEQGDRSDARSAESLQGDQADYLLAARQRQLRAKAIAYGLA